MTMENFATQTEAALRACKEAAICIMKGYADADLVTGAKTDAADVYTPVDAQAQDIIRTVLREAFPNYGFLGEEDEGGLIPREEYYWVVDPLDGTSNYSHKLPHFGTSIALMKNGVSVMGVLHFPVSGDTYTAVEGGGAKKNGKPIRVRECDSIEKAVLAEMFSDRVHRGTNVLYPPGVAYRRFGSAVTSMAFLAEGKVHGVSLRCRLWDIAAVSLIVREAGALCVLQHDDPADMRSPLYFAAATPGIFKAFTDLIRASYNPDLR